jgi:hypothetical protein
MRRLTAFVLVAGVLGVSGLLVAQGRIKQYGRSTVEFKSEDALAVVNYDFAQKNHAGPWLLLDFAIQATPRVAITRDQFSLRDAGERMYKLASQKEFLEDQAALNKLKQNAVVLRRSLATYFTSPVEDSIHFFAWPRTVVQDSFTTNLDDVAAGDLLFKTPDGKWAPGTYHLIVNHDKVKVDIPLELK